MLVLAYHPVSDKNRGLKQKFEKFAEKNIQNTSLILVRYNGVNESAVYRSPIKLPAIMLFKR